MGLNCRHGTPRNIRCSCVIIAFALCMCLRSDTLFFWLQARRAKGDFSAGYIFLILSLNVLDGEEVDVQGNPSTHFRAF